MIFVLILFLCGVAFLSLTYYKYQGRALTSEEFLVAGRDVGIGFGSLSLLASWAAAPAVLVPAQLAFERGPVTAMWFTIPNALTLVVFGVIAVQIKDRLPDGYTITETFGYDDRYLSSIIILTTFMKTFVALGVSVIGGATFLTSFSELSRPIAVIILLTTILSYSLISGLQSSIFTDVVQMMVFFIIFLFFVPWSVSAGNGIELFISGLSSEIVTGSFSTSGFFIFNLIVVLFTAPILNQHIWQRAYAIKDNKVLQASTAAAVLFFFIPMSMAILGLVAEQSSVPVNNPILAGYVGIAENIPFDASVIVFGLLLMMLISTADSALVGCASIISVDIIEGIKRDNCDRVRTTRLSMIAITVFLGLASILPLNFLDWVLLNAPLGALVAVPIVTSLYAPRLINARRLTPMLAVATVVSLPLYVIASVDGNNEVRAGALIFAFFMSGTPILIEKFFRNDMTGDLRN